MNYDKKLQCFTIGHSVHDIDKFINILLINNINCVLDVRSIPYSKYTPQFNRESLKKSLKLNNIYYIYMGHQLGARYTDPNLLFPDGKVNFEKVRKTKFFQSGIERVIRGLKQGYRIAIMCSEKDPFDCHRFVLVSYELQKKGIEIKHILEDGKIISNQELENKLIDIYEPNFCQLNLLSPPKSRDEALENAYRKRGLDIAYIQEMTGGKKENDSLYNWFYKENS